MIGSSTGLDLLVSLIERSLDDDMQVNNNAMVTANASSDPMLTKIYSELVANEFNDALVILDSVGREKTVRKVRGRKGSEVRYHGASFKMSCLELCANRDLP